MTTAPLVSVLLNNHNYGRFLGSAIESVLAQSYPRVELIVVDDGSTDDSRRIISSYGNQVTGLFKDQGGQGSAFNAGFRICSGDVLCLLDADDTFWPTKVEEVIRFMTERRLLEGDVVVFHDLQFVDATGNPVATPKRLRRHAEGDNYYALAKAHGYAIYPTYQPSGVALTRSLARRIFPVPEGYPTGGDSFLLKAAGLLGSVYGIQLVLSNYRIHDANHWFRSGRMKPRSFYEDEMRFLNARLVQHGLQPVIHTLDPWHLRGYYLEDRRPMELLKLALWTPSHDRDLKRLRFSAKTLGLAAAVAGMRLFPPHLRSAPRRQLP